MVLIAIGLAGMAYAQQKDLKAEQILNAVSTKYKSYKSVQADFVLKIESGQSDTKDQQTGTLYVKGNKYKLQINNQEIISDNNTVWTYLKDANEVQINSFEKDDNSISPSEIFTIYEKNFLYAFAEEKNVGGKIIQFIDLTPNDKSKPYFKVRLAIDKAAKAIQSAVVFDKNGNRYTYEIKKFTANPDLNDTFFAFDSKKYPGIEVVDLR
jgi:outer membrane lipoprotein-sorting protein